MYLIFNNTVELVQEIGCDSLNVIGDGPGCILYCIGLGRSPSENKSKVYFYKITEWTTNEKKSEIIKLNLVL